MARITEYVGHLGVRSSALDQWRAANPMPGDLIRWPDGTYGRIESLHDGARGWAREGEVHVCVELGSAFLGWNEGKRRPTVTISGGPFRSVKLAHLKFDGTRVARFWNWGDNHVLPGADKGCEYHLARPVYAYTPPEEDA